jgi:hypothetical protein
MCSSLDAASVTKTLKDADQVMVYGFNHCYYSEVKTCIENLVKKPGFPIKKTFDFEVGSPASSKELVTTLEGREMNVIHEENSIEDQCKCGIANLILENYKRKKEGRTLIPILFSIDIEGNPKSHTFKDIVVNMTSKDPKFNQVITYKELRRAYKLCSHEVPAIRDVARETFKFIRLKHAGKETYALEAIAAPWESPEFEACWVARKKLSKSKPKENSWRIQLDRQIAEYERVSAPKIETTKRTT